VWSDNEGKGARGEGEGEGNGNSYRESEEPGKLAIRGGEQEWKEKGPLGFILRFTDFLYKVLYSKVSVQKKSVKKEKGIFIWRRRGEPCDLGSGEKGGL